MRLKASKRVLMIIIFYDIDSLTYFLRRAVPSRTH